MTAALALPAADLAPSSPLRVAEDAAQRFASLALAPRTREAYGAQWHAFVAWARLCGLEVLPALPSTLASYIAHLAQERGTAPASIDLALAAISTAHLLAGLPSPRSAPEVRLVRKGLRRDRGTAQKQAEALTPAQLRAMVEALPDDLHGKRDRALLLLGFATALRRSEFVALDVADVRFVDEGLEVNVRKSKTDQEGQGRVVAVHRGARADTCPVRALRAWLDAAGITEGPLFRGFAGKGAATLTGRLGDRDVARVLKRAAERAGVVGDFSGHSLRAGAATAAARAGTHRADICELTGHKPTGKMVDRYTRAARRFAVNPLAGVL